MRVSHLAAMATLVALLGAMFIAMGSASAADALKLTLRWDHDNDGSTSLAVESDNVVKAGTSFQLWAEIVDDADSDTTLTTAFNPDNDYIVSTPSGLVVREQSDAVDDIGEGMTGAKRIGDLIVPPGTPNGTFTVSVKAGTRTGSLMLDVGDVGTPIGSAEVVVGNVVQSGNNAGQFGMGEGTGADADSKTKGKAIAVTVNVKNSLGNKPNGHEVTNVILFAPAARISQDATAGGSDFAWTDDSSSSASSLEATTAGVSTNFHVWSGDERSVGVYAVVVGEGGSTTTADLTLSFTGNADVISVNAVDSPIASANGASHADVTAKDKSGSDAELPVANITKVEVVDSDGKAVKNTVATAYQGPKSGVDFDAGTEPNDISADADGDICYGTNGSTGGSSGNVTELDEGCDITSVRVVITTAEAGATPGTYSLHVTLDSKDPVSTDVIIAGKVHNVALSTEWGDHNIVTVSATVTDEDGNLFPDSDDGTTAKKNNVVFQAVGDLDLRGLGTGVDDMNKNVVTSALNEGMTMARYVAIGDSGSATIIASIDGVDGVTTVMLEGEPEEAMPEEEASVSCLSELSGFATWSCGVSADASEIFEMVSARGVSAIHLWNGSTWVRYSVVDDAMVPGSSDFMVTENDILYISN